MAVLAALGTTGLGVSVAFLALKAAARPPTGVVRVPGLAEPVRVALDSFAIPHVFARTLPDAFRAQGFLHARERLWQMEILHRTARGELAELFGPDALPVDRLVRTLDLWGAAERSVAALPDSVRLLLEAYAEGVNAGIASRRGWLPPEFLLLRFRPRPWDPRASVAVGKVMTLDLSHWRHEISRLRASVELDSARLSYLSLPYPEWGPAMVDHAPGLLSGLARAVPDGAGHRGMRSESAGSGDSGETGWDPIDVLTDLGFHASNAWAVSGARTRSGRPLLANDMHLALRAPATWYLAVLHADTPSLHVAGLSLPGVPGIVVGTNGQVAWGFTNAMVDDMDFVIEAVNLDRSAYRDGDRWVPFAVRAETLRVRGRSDPLVLRVRETRRGPVLSDVLTDVGFTLSVLWAGREPRTAADGLLAMNRAPDADAFERALRRFSSPHQNVVYATASGDIGYRLAGSVPRRNGWDGSVPVSFERVDGGWAGFWPPERLPAERNPRRGFVATANNLQAPEAFGRIGIDYPLPFRARRIVDRLSSDDQWTVAKTLDLQGDTYSLWADRLLARAREAATRIGREEAADLLEAWDRRVTVDARAATLFHVWLYRLRTLLAADEFQGMRAWEWFPDAALLKLLEEGGGPWVDDVRTGPVETLAELEEQAMRDALRVAADRPWGQVHRERSAHLLGRIGWLNRIFGFDVGPYPAPGGPHTVRPDDPGRWAPLDSTSWKPPFRSQYGPSERFVVELDPERSVAFFLLPTGQSGNPFSRHYRDMVGRWQRLEPLPVSLREEGISGRARYALELRPARRSGRSEATPAR